MSNITCAKKKTRVQNTCGKGFKGKKLIKITQKIGLLAAVISKNDFIVKGGGGLEAEFFVILCTCN
jgi:hypothetical protein